MLNLKLSLEYQTYDVVINTADAEGRHLDGPFQYSLTEDNFHNYLNLFSLSD